MMPSNLQDHRFENTGNFGQDLSHFNNKIMVLITLKWSSTNKV